MGDQRKGASDETLIAYVRGRLPDDEAERLAAMAERDPGLAAEIALARGIAAAVDEDAAVPVPGELGWARLSRSLDSEPRAAAPRTRLSLWPLAASAAAAVLVWQVVAVPFLSAPVDQPGSYAPVAEQPLGERSLTVAFAPSATEEAIRALLREVGAQISDGPSAIGLWQLSFESAAARDGGVAALRGADIIESVQVE